MVSWASISTQSRRGAEPQRVFSTDSNAQDRQHSSRDEAQNLGIRPGGAAHRRCPARSAGPRLRPLEPTRWNRLRPPDPTTSNPLRPPDPTTWNRLRPRAPTAWNRLRPPEPTAWYSSSFLHGSPPILATSCPRGGFGTSKPLVSSSAGTLGTLDVTVESLTAQVRVFEGADLTAAQRDLHAPTLLTAEKDTDRRRGNRESRKMHGIGNQAHAVGLPKQSAPVDLLRVRRQPIDAEVSRGHSDNFLIEVVPAVASLPESPRWRHRRFAPPMVPGFSGGVCLQTGMCAWIRLDVLGRSDNARTRPAQSQQRVQRTPSGFLCAGESRQVFSAASACSASAFGPSSENPASAEPAESPENAERFSVDLRWQATPGRMTGSPLLPSTSSEKAEPLRATSRSFPVL